MVQAEVEYVLAADITRERINVITNIDVKVFVFFTFIFPAFSFV